MRKRTVRFVILAAVIVVVTGAGAILLFLLIFDRAMAPFAPQEHTGKAEPVFRATLPDIYHFLVEQEGYHASHLRVQSVLAGQWATLTLERSEDASIDRQTALALLEDQFAAHGWQVATDVQVVHGPDDACFEPNPDQLTPEDLIYSHGPLSEDRWRHVTAFNCRIFVSDDASTIVAYCELVW